ncbi:putative lactate 2-monooxygenase PB1A11.03 [Lachnellula cervina]|uniref:Putative lactate 2-monooxygenase PB1A11.03 n=1 Tax=Lachnellula cervina TaxID=1316786 RepID=A0A7D8UU43_9HELO|nr:putative lactate 2-monooxygenase PB1A11.03 [Lachnellula cervina]
MSDPNNPNIESRSTPQWGLYQRELFWKDNTGEVPPFSTDPGDLEELAKKSLTSGGWHVPPPLYLPPNNPANLLYYRYYASSNAGQSYTHLANRQAFYRHRIIPRMLVDTNTRDTSTTIFGHKVSAPIGFAPIGINKIYHPLGELPVAKVAKELNLPYCLSTAGSCPIEDVGAANGAGPRFFQLYMPHDDELTLSLLQRAHDSGFTACILTLDTWQLAWRHHDTAGSNYAFLSWGIDAKEQPNEAGALWIDNVWHGRAWSWEKMPWLMEQWRRISGGKPFCLKGIQSVVDARKAVELGVDGIVVSNHAGRQVDGAVASLDALEKIVNAVGDKTYIMFDSGVRGAADIFKALALGAKFVFVGRLWVFGLSIKGELGVRHVMKSLLADFDILMNVSGYQSVDQITRDSIDSLPNTAAMIAEKSKL